MYFKFHKREHQYIYCSYYHTIYVHVYDEVMFMPSIITKYSSSHIDYTLRCFNMHDCPKSRGQHLSSMAEYLYNIIFKANIIS